MANMVQLIAPIMSLPSLALAHMCLIACTAEYSSEQAARHATSTPTISNSYVHFDY